MSSTPASSHLSAPTALPERRPSPRYRLRLADSEDDLRAAQALRFAVFNLELNEGLPQSYDTGLDADPFDEVCDHLLVEDAQSGAIVGTYRLQTGLRAGASRGYYSEREFDFTPFEAARPLILELGRACIHQRHRHFTVLNLLWRGIASYAREHGVRYLVGCSSLNSQEAGEGWAAYRAMARHLAPPAWRTQPMRPFVCPQPQQPAAAPRLPRLLSAYLALGAEICGPPAIDREFRTIDFLTLLDLHSPGVMALQARGRLAGRGDDQADGVSCAARTAALGARQPDA